LNPSRYDLILADASAEAADAILAELRPKFTHLQIRFAGRSKKLPGPACGEHYHAGLQPAYTRYTLDMPAGADALKEDNVIFITWKVGRRWPHSD
jgi:hypothetical protein